MTMTAAAVGPQRYEKVYPSEFTTVREVRKDVSLALYTWLLDDLVDDTALVVSEMITNVIVHTDTSKIRTAIVRTGARAVRLEVTDRSGDKPLGRAAGTDVESGRGIALIDTLADSWGWELVLDGKKVWAELSV